MLYWGGGGGGPSVLELLEPLAASPKEFGVQGFGLRTFIYIYIDIDIDIDI